MRNGLKDLQRFGRLICKQGIGTKVNISVSSGAFVGFCVFAVAEPKGW
jgi:hypothetical protein